MFRPRSHAHSNNTVPPILPPPRKRRALTRRRLFVLISLSVFVCLLLLSQVFSNWSLWIKSAQGASDGSITGGLTYQQFASEGRPNNVYHGPAVIPANSPSRVKPPKGPFASYANLPPSAEPATMKPISLSLDTAYQTAGSSAKTLDLLGSDGRLELVIQPGAFDLTKATVASGTAPQGSLTLHFSQVSGHFVGWLNELGTYQLQLLDGHGSVVNGILLRTPITFIYHYQQTELNALGIDAGHLLMTWPTLLAAAQTAHASTTNLSIPLKNDPKTHTLTGQSTVLDSNMIKFGIATPSNQAPSSLHLASVQGNSGQFT